MRIVEDDGCSFLCAICEDFGELICCEQCGAGYHLQCLNLEALPEEDVWFCDHCKNNQVYCFECKQLGDANESYMLKCEYKSCKKFYHRSCTVKWERAPKSKKKFFCPHHICNACGSTQNSGQWKLFRCFECPNAYHENCCPENSELLEDISGYMICWKHDGLWQRQPLDGKKIHNPSEVFDVLPIPDHFCEFEVPRLYIDLVRKLKNKSQTFAPIRRNIYLVKKPKKRTKDMYMQCTCTLVDSCERDCICSMLQYSCSESCGCGPACKNLPFQKRQGRRLELIKTERCGWGLIAAESIKAGDFIIEYVGEVIDDKTCEERLWGMKERGESNFYMCEINREMVIDATFKGNVSRFINHSCSPNTELQKWQIDEEIRIGVFAISDIAVGEAISYDYQFIPFGQEQECFCGTSSCRGRLGPKLKKQKISATMALEIVAKEVLMKSRPTKRICNSIEKMFPYKKSFPTTSNSGDKGTAKPPCVGLRVKIWWPLDEKYYSAEIIDFDEQKKAHKILYDDGAVEVLDMEEEKWELENPVIPQHKRRPEEPSDAYPSEESYTVMINRNMVSK